MIDKQEKNKENLETPPTAAVMAVAAPPAVVPPLEKMAVEPAQPQMSKGEKWYNRIVYQGINYWVNLGLSLYFTDIFTHGGGKLDFTRGGGKRFYDKGVRAIAHGLNSGKLSKKTADRAAEVMLGTFTLNTGGNLLLIPLKWLEDRKRPVVHWLNKNVFHEQQLASDGHEKTPDEIYIDQEQPEQSWGRVIWRRIQGVSATIGTGLVADWALRRKLDTPKIENGEIITHEDGTKRFSRWITGGANYVLNSVPGGAAVVKNSTAQRYIGYAALDSIYTAITSIVMYRTRGAKHLKGHGKKEAEIFRETDQDIDLPDDAAPDVTKPPIAKNSGTPAVAPALPEEKLGGYKKSSIMPVEKFADRARAGEPDYSLAP